MTDHLLVAPHRGNGFASWVETIGLTALTLLLGYWAEPTDPLHVFSAFAWSVFAPLLLALRYGFFQALVSALLLIATLVVLHLQEYGDYQELPSAFMVGILASAMISGEFRDLWARRLESLQRISDYREVRLEEFTRAHQILRISHDRLAQRLAGNDQSLRSVLLAMRQRMRQLQLAEQTLDGMAEAILDLFSQYGPLRQAALYRVAEGKLKGQSLAMIGEMPEVSADDPLVRLTLEKGELVSIRPELLEQGEIVTGTPLLACIPLTDSHNSIHALVLVQNMPFFAFNERNLNLLAILGGHIADLLVNNAQAALYRDADAQRFAQLCQRSLLDARRYEIPAFLLGIELRNSSVGAEVEHLLRTQQRGLDVIWTALNRKNVNVVLVLLPLTAEDGLSGYLERIRLTVLENLGLSLEAAGLVIHRHKISSVPANVKRARQFLQKECELDEQQVAIH